MRSKKHQKQELVLGALLSRAILTVFRLATAESLVQKATDTELEQALWLTLDPK